MVLNNLATQLQTLQVELTATKQELAETKTRLAAAEVARPEPAQPHPPPLVPLSEADDIEAYLSTFERTATRNLWQRTEWASIITPYLKGIAQKAYHDLPIDEAVQYDLLKAEILSHYGVTSDQQASEWRHWRYDPDLPARAQGFKFWGKMGCWLRPDINQGRQIVEQVACEGFINAMPDFLAQQVRRHPFQDIKSLLDVLQHQLVVNRVGGPERSARGVRQGCVAVPEPHRRTQETPAKPREKLPTLPRCFKCGEVGHTLPACPQNVKMMDCSCIRGKR
ncbi:uncharacterized protein LOC120520795 [Polypterus senegalus]|uniref:uncharacterized protein LOC120520795 n=1 Tax=Polypterus senegalus TaxID=55291 RepID=UPI001962EC46|nr:uncharacterized protein LOC120520795 [Polypterus senegalus]XP_039598813.1 uncharacterized protein LOC120520795 [Polypterus senegalus]